MKTYLTVEEIHRLRYEDYEATKNFSKRELIAKTNKAAEVATKEIQAIRANSH